MANASKTCHLNDLHTFTHQKIETRVWLNIENKRRTCDLCSVNISNIEKSVTSECPTYEEPNMTFKSSYNVVQPEFMAFLNCEIRKHKVESHHDGFENHSLVIYSNINLNSWHF